MGVPDRWLDYCPYGEVIKGTRFLPFKVPLKQTLCDMLEKGNRFNIPGFLEGLQGKGLKLGLVIDLTNTTRYYFKKDFERQGVLYAKIFTEGHVVPSDTVYGKFFGIIEKFLDANKNSEAIIGVHCTHGVNRTGQLLCRYMIEKLHMDPQMALEAFKEARGHSIERDLYISDLLQRRPGASDPSVDWRSEEFQAWDVEVPRERKPRHRHWRAAAEGRGGGSQDPSLSHSSNDGGPDNWRERSRVFKRELHPYLQQDAGPRSWREDGRNWRNGLDQHHHHHHHQDAGSRSWRDDGGKFKNGSESHRSHGSRRRTRWDEAESCRNGSDAHHSQSARPGGWRDDGQSTNGHEMYSQQGTGAERWRGSSGYDGSEQSWQQGRGPIWNGPNAHLQQHASYSSQRENGQQNWRRPHSSPLHRSASSTQVGRNSYSSDGTHSSPHVASQSAFVMNATYPPPHQQGWNASLYPAQSCPQQGGNVSMYNPSSTHGATSVGWNGNFQDHFPPRSSSDRFHVDHRQSAQHHRNHSRAPKQE